MLLAGGWKTPPGTTERRPHSARGDLQMAAAGRKQSRRSLERSPRRNASPSRLLVGRENGPLRREGPLEGRAVLTTGNIGPQVRVVLEKSQILGPEQHTD